MKSISVIILSHNEEQNITDCVESVPQEWEIIVIDDDSSDRTVALAESLKRDIKVFKHSLNNNFSEQRNFGLSKATCEWILFLDADERLNKNLIEELEAKTRQEINNGFRIKRVDHMWGKTLQFGELKNMWLLRFAKRGSGEWTGKVHEVWNIKGKIGKTTQVLDHYPHPTITEFLKEINFYTTLRARELYKSKAKVSGIDIILYPKAKFLQNYFWRLGFKDGIPGFIYAVLMSFHSFLVRGKLWLLYHQK